MAYSTVAESVLPGVLVLGMPVFWTTNPPAAAQSRSYMVDKSTLRVSTTASHVLSLYLKAIVMQW